jgi:hypothetical protein
MEARAATVGVQGTVPVHVPHQPGVEFLGCSPCPTTQSAHSEHYAGYPYMGVGGAVEVAEGDFAALPNFSQSAVNCETNASTHNLERALQEAADLNDWFTVLPPVAPRMFARTASFCTERSGHFDGYRSRSCVLPAQYDMVAATCIRASNDQ